MTVGQFSKVRENFQLGSTYGSSLEKANLAAIETASLMARLDA